MKAPRKMTGLLEERRPTRRPQSSRREYAARVLIAAGIVLGAVLLVLTVILGIRVIFIGFLAILLAVMLRGAADWIARRTGLSTRWTLAGVIVLLFGSIALAAIFLVPQLVAQVAEVKDNVVSSWPQLRQSLSGTPLGEELLRRIPDRPGSIISSPAILQHLKKVFSFTLFNATGLLVLVFVGIYLSVDPGLYIRGITRLFPYRQRRGVQATLQILGHTLRWWLLGTFVEMTFVGILTTVALAIAGVPLAAGLGGLSGLLTFIPTFGVLVSLVPAVLIALATSGTKTAILTIVLYIIIHSTDLYLIAPLVQKRAVSLPPVLTITSLFAFGLAFGTIGLIVATPLTAALMVFIRTVYVENLLERRGIEGAEVAEGAGSDGDDRSRLRPR